ncbi:PREDICTED: uncharacterized protein LOC107329237 [Acropora digitifera]|uniref:uncharacterized protein LOC107329237 n=1 Tax=Acropora digitifera TaxID=70779 RepID=UPI00077A638D|nr:PREDICTED: uncharacterized protein LOC107329237 [Acropora digitifera]
MYQLHNLTRMELTNHRDVIDKDLVNFYGAVAYDYESLPKVVAVHTWAGDMPSSKSNGKDTSSSCLEEFPRNLLYSSKIGVRSIVRAGNKDKLKRWSSLGNSCFANRNLDHEDNAFNKAEDNKTFGSEPELLLTSVERCLTNSATSGFKSSGNSEIANRNLEELDNSSVYERTPGGNHSGNSEIANRNLEELDNSSVYERTPGGSLQNSSSVNSFSGVCQSTETPVLPKEIVLDSRPRKRPRKSTPRKIDQGWQNKCLVARVGEFKRKECASETDSASESELPMDNEVLLQSPGVESQESSLKADPSGGTKVLFKRTEGVWSVSLLQACSETSSCPQEIQNSTPEPSQSVDETDVLQPCQGSYSEGQGMAASNDVSVELPATGHMYDSGASSEGMFISSALDRESRIKELLSRQEQLLKEMRQRKEGD